MSDTPQGEGWWLASDGKYYPPQNQPQAQAVPAYAADVASPPPPLMTTASSTLSPAAGTALLVAAGAALLVMISSFLTWATVKVGSGGTTLFEQSLKGTEEGNDGTLTVVLGGIALVLALIAKFKGLAGKAIPIIVIVLGVLTVLIGIIDIADVADADNIEGASASVGIGLWLVTIAGVGVVAGGVLALLKR
ncbi:MAG: hypothetical protein KDB21_13455 [Acidimicrobiales bacterium]|nr:hypothetical protein [Acidimicrobiales bacterium]